MEIMTHTPQGIIKKKLTEAEIIELAAIGDIRAKKHILNKEWHTLDLPSKVERLKELMTGA